jgi:AraC family transcriptional regulator, regulatory protein of adaptative response / methylated-DNA-[protein]-cysteine methyltransferase
MSEQQSINYKRIAEAISYIEKNFKNQPNLDEVAEKVNMSPFHFQRLFSEWVGTSPKKFLQFTTVEYAKSLLLNNKTTLFDAAYQAGLSGTGRLHDLFVSLEGMTPAEFKNGGRDLRINFSFAATIFGTILVASTSKGICYMAFCDDQEIAFQTLKSHFPNAYINNQIDSIQRNVLAIFNQDLCSLHLSSLSKIKLHLKGTDFQLKVWQTLLKIPMGQLTSYGLIANEINNPKASRAVGTAIGSNPVAFLIPCHRVIQASGAFGDYMWGSARKTAMIAWEAQKTQD